MTIILVLNNKDDISTYINHMFNIKYALHQLKSKTS
jgi:hypothetical protein